MINNLTNLVSSEDFLREIEENQGSTSEDEQSLD